MKIADIIEAVAQVTRLEPQLLCSAGRQKTTATAKHLARWMCRDLLDHSYPEIAKAFRRDHTTIMHSVKVADKLLETDDGFRALYMNALAILAGGPRQSIPSKPTSKPVDKPVDKNEKARVRKPKQVVDWAQRKCLGGCGEAFLSWGVGNRICKRCASTAGWKEGSLTEHTRHTSKRRTGRP